MLLQTIGRCTVDCLPQMESEKNMRRSDTILVVSFKMQRQTRHFSTMRAPQSLKPLCWGFSKCAVMLCMGPTGLVASHLLVTLLLF